MSDFDFGAATTEDAWHPRLQDTLPKGNWLVKVTEVENETSSGGYPMLKITLETDLGRQWDNLVISPNEFSVGKLFGLTDSAGLPRPVPDTDMSTQDGRLTDAYVNKLIGKTVGVVVRDEEDNREDHKGEFRPRVQGYVDPKLLTAATTGPMGGSTSPGNGTTGKTESKLAF